MQVLGERLRLLASTGNGQEKGVDVEATLATAGVTLLDRRRTEPTLEDVFVASIEAVEQAAESEGRSPEVGDPSPISNLQSPTPNPQLPTP
ncbi:MAG: hypothetical protein GTN71_09275, partial [Anaerolineae bacterium]|nr:hypothetical protein [Anaerolineae bacterium]